MEASTCLPKEKLQALEAGALTETEEMRLLAHIETCERCQQLWDAIEAPSDVVTRWLSELPVTQDDEHELNEARVNLLKRRALTEPTIQYDPLSDLLCADRQNQALQDENASSHRSTGKRISEPSTLIHPQNLHEYEIRERLGQGGAGCVYLARHTKLDRLVAVKVVEPERGGGEEGLNRFIREMQAVGKLSHPNIIHAYDAGEDQGYQYLVMEYLPGLDLGTLVQRVGPLSIANACEAIRQAAVGLEYARRQGFIHRDVKASNLLLTGRGQVKVLDLGLVGSTIVDHVNSQPVLSVRGTADYMPPEQWENFDGVDSRADVYALGCTLYKLVHGKPPYRISGQTLVDKLTAHRSQPPPPLMHGGKGAPAALQTFLHSMLAKDPCKRPSTPGEVALAMRRWASGADLHALALTAGVPDLGRLPDELALERRRKTMARRAVLAAVVGVGAVGARTWLNRSIAAPLRQSGERMLPLVNRSFLYADRTPSEKQMASNAEGLIVNAKQWAWVDLGQPVEQRYRLSCCWNEVENIKGQPLQNALAGENSSAARYGMFFEATPQGARTFQGDAEMQLITVERLAAAGEEAKIVWSMMSLSKTSTKDEDAEWALKESVIAEAPVIWKRGESCEISAVIGATTLPRLFWQRQAIPQSKLLLAKASAMVQETLPTEKGLFRPGKLGGAIFSGTALLSKFGISYFK